MKQKVFERTAGNLNPRLLQKMAYFCLVGVKHLNSFLYTIIDPITGTIPDRFDLVKYVTYQEIGNFYS
jgi:hypothetical protein